MANHVSESTFWQAIADKAEAKRRQRDNVFAMRVAAYANRPRKKRKPAKRKKSFIQKLFGL